LAILNAASIAVITAYQMGQYRGKLKNE